MCFYFINWPGWAEPNECHEKVGCDNGPRKEEDNFYINGADEESSFSVSHA